MPGSGGALEVGGTLGGTGGDGGTIMLGVRLIAASSVVSSPIASPSSTPSLASAGLPS